MSNFPNANRYRSTGRNTAEPRTAPQRSRQSASKGVHSEYRSPTNHARVDTDDSGTTVWPWLLVIAIAIFLFPIPTLIVLALLLGFGLLSSKG
jgi:hypothetical protein